MKFIFSMALKNILRYKRRTLLTFIILSAGIALYILMMGFIKGLSTQAFENQIQFESGDFKIRSMTFDEDSPYDLSNFISNYRSVEAVLRTKSYIKSYTERVQFTADLDNGRVSAPIIATGINLITDNSVFSLTNFIYEGNLRPGGAVIGKILASNLNIAVGDTVYITFHNSQNTIDSIDLEITGLISSPDPQVDNSAVFINLNEALMFLNSDSVSEIAIKTIDYHKYARFEPDLKMSLPGYNIYDWIKMGEDTVVQTQSREKIFSIFLFFIAIIGLIGIINTMLISVYQKQREIGTMKALGMTDGEVQTLFVLEGFMIGFFGSLFGILCGIIICLYPALVGLDITSIFGTTNISGFNVLGIVKFKLDPGTIAGPFIVGVIFSALASYYPARKATRLEIADCLKKVQ